MICIISLIDELEAQAHNFKRGATKVRKRMWWNDMKMKIILAFVIIAIIVIIICKYSFFVLFLFFLFYFF